MIRVIFDLQSSKLGILAVIVSLLSLVCPPLTTLAHGNPYGGSLQLLSMTRAGHEAGQVNSTRNEHVTDTDETLALREAILNAIELLGIRVSDLEEFERIVPADVLQQLTALIAIAELNASSEEKMAALIHISQSCNNYLYNVIALWVVQSVFSLVPIDGVINAFFNLAELYYAVSFVVCIL